MWHHSHVLDGVIANWHRCGLWPIGPNDNWSEPYSYRTRLFESEQDTSDSYQFRLEDHSNTHVMFHADSDAGFTANLYDEER